MDQAFEAEGRVNCKVTYRRRFVNFFWCLEVWEECLPTYYESSKSLDEVLAYVREQMNNFHVQTDNDNFRARIEWKHTGTTYSESGVILLRVCK